jgi:hypothetical protein
MTRRAADIEAGDDADDFHEIEMSRWKPWPTDRLRPRFSAGWQTAGASAGIALSATFDFGFVYAIPKILCPESDFQIPDFKFKIRNSKFKFQIQNSNSKMSKIQIQKFKIQEIQNPKSKIQNPKSKIQNPKSKI